MALPGTPGGGQSISMSQINTELGRSATATISLNSAEDGTYAAINTCSQYKPSASNPATMDEWHGYNHTTSCGIACGGSEYDIEPSACEVPSVRVIDLGGNVSGTVNVPWTFTLSSGFTLNQFSMYIVYNGSTVASTGLVEVTTPAPIASGTLTFNVDGSASTYTVYFTDPYCY